MSAGITYNQVSSAVTNPQTYYIPVNNNDNFVDSNLTYDFSVFQILDKFGDAIISASTGSDVFLIGNGTINTSFIYINIGGYLELDAPIELRINAPTSTTPPTLPPVYLPVNVNGSNYKIKLQPA